ncbi:MAG: flagellar basal body P-ring formation protein FlgA [Candidatus Eisenbacteria sp.]|nr:flagellar basal body P-ring formation protein FlgA [Candidatus Eisenbacteria bacterium]
MTWISLEPHGQERLPARARGVSERSCLVVLAMVAIALMVSGVGRGGRALASTSEPVPSGAGEVAGGADASAESWARQPWIVHDGAGLHAALDVVLGAAFPEREVRWTLPREHSWEHSKTGAGTDYRLIIPERLRGGRNWFHLQPPGGGGAFLLPVEVSWRDTAWVALRALPAGHIVTPADLDRQVCWHTHPPAEVRDCTAPVGGRLMKSVGCGALITLSLIGTPPLVERGDVVRLVYRSSGLEIATRASAMEEGWAGEAIRVRPLDSRRICQARICGVGEAEVIVP